MIKRSWKPFRMTTRRAFTLVETLVVIGVMGLLISLMIPAIQMVRAAMDRAACVANLRQIGQAVYQFHNDHGSVPPGRHMLRIGPLRHMLRWEVGLLPYVGRGDLWEQALQNWHSRNTKSASSCIGSSDSCLYLPLGCPAQISNHRWRRHLGCVWHIHGRFWEHGAKGCFCRPIWKTWHPLIRDNRWLKSNAHDGGATASRFWTSGQMVSQFRLSSILGFSVCSGTQFGHAC